MNTRVNENYRIEAIDMIRGLVMIIMALDHTRDFFHSTSLTQNPTDLSNTTALLFFTRWITHLCAPTFVFLSGVSAYLSFKRKNDLRSSRLFLLKRGFWLLLLEFTLINFGVWFDLRFQLFLFAVIGAIGVGFIILSALMVFRPSLIGLIGMLIIIMHNVIPASASGAFPATLFSPGTFPIGSSLLIIGYPVIPWTGIMLAGFGAGAYFKQAIQKRSRFFLFTGIFLIAFFIALRFLNFYGDPVKWQPSNNTLHTLLSFINVTKYPPSLLFTSLMLGLTFLLLRLSPLINPRLQAILMVYGRVPLFYFIIHWYILHPLLFVVLFSQGFSADEFKFGSNFGRPDAPSGLSLAGVYLIWLSVVILLYPICRWYNRYKTAHPENKWLRYL